MQFSGTYFMIALLQEKPLDILLYVIKKISCENYIILFKMSILILYTFIFETERKNDTERSLILICSLNAYNTLSQAKARSLEFFAIILHHDCQRLKHLSHHLLFHKTYVQQNARIGNGIKLKLRHSVWASQAMSLILHHRPTTNFISILDTAGKVYIPKHTQL